MNYLKNAIYNVLRILRYIAEIAGVIFLLSYYFSMTGGHVGYISDNTAVYSSSKMDDISYISLDAGDTVSILRYDDETGIARIRYPEDGSISNDPTIGFVPIEVCKEFNFPSSFGNYDISNPLILRVLSGTSFEEFVSEFSDLSQEHSVVGVYIDDYPLNNTASDISYFCESLGIPYGSCVDYSYDSYKHYTSTESDSYDDTSFKILPKVFVVTREPNTDGLENCIFYTGDFKLPNSWIVNHTDDDDFPERSSIVFNDHPLVELKSNSKFSYSYPCTGLLDEIVAMRNGRYSEED